MAECDEAESPKTLKPVLNKGETMSVGDSQRIMVSGRHQRDATNLYRDGAWL